MSPASGPRRGWQPERPGVRGWVTLGVAVAVVAGIGLGGSALPVETVSRGRAAAPAAGRTSAVCVAGTGGTLAPDGTAASPSAAPDSDQVRTMLTAVTGRRTASGAGSGSGGTGSVTGRLLRGDRAGSGGSQTDLDLTAPGQTGRLQDPSAPVLLSADGSLATAAAGSVLVRADQGQRRGLASAPCVLPAVNQWLVGLGATDDVRDEIVLSNPDTTDADVDLRLYGQDGPITAAGASGITVPGSSARLVSLGSLTRTTGPIAVEVRASSGRVAAVAQETRTASGPDGTQQPAGTDLHPASLTPARRQVVPGIPGGPGSRTLTVVNPGLQRAEVKIEILGPEGPFSPVGATELTLPPQSTGQVDLATGLGGQIGTVRLSADQPVTAAVTSVSTASGGSGGTPAGSGDGGSGDGGSGDTGSAAADVAVETAQPSLGPLAIAPDAIVADTTAELAISNASSRAVVVGLQIFGLDGASLYRENVPVGPNATAARRLSQPAPAYAVLTVPDGAEVYAGTTLAGTLGSGADRVSALTSTGVVTPDPDARARVVVDDPQVAR